MQEFDELREMVQQKKKRVKFQGAKEFCYHKLVQQ